MLNFWLFFCIKSKIKENKKYIMYYKCVKHAWKYISLLNTPTHTHTHKHTQNLHTSVYKPTQPFTYTVYTHTRTYTKQVYKHSHTKMVCNYYKWRSEWLFKQKNLASLFLTVIAFFATEVKRDLG